ncbi:SMP-30/gluconolactonase/LRE family protein [Actinoplanes sp. CA-030573]|uniref:SMP-30/gluconolactonase/LRE family protein n=1 Tax=Actinoplanes sp. CA-030573 TaxID=3239898 RepID=UPI003D92C171
MITYTATPVSPDAYTLGEGPIWDPLRERLLWVDIQAGKVFAGRVSPFAVLESWSFDSVAAAVAVAENGTLLVATADSLVRVDRDGKRTTLARVLFSDASRLNDGGVDPDGRYLIGSMSLSEKSGSEILVRFENGELTTIDDDLTLSNGLAWVGDQLYSIDSTPQVVYGRTYPDGPRRELFRVEAGLPDGMCADRDGNLWIAAHGAGRVERRSPAGELLAVVEVAASQPTSVAFAGPQLDVLVITTATDGLDAPAEHDGRIFTTAVETAGLLTPYWNPAL